MRPPPTPQLSAGTEFYHPNSVRPLTQVIGTSAPSKTRLRVTIALALPRPVPMFDAWSEEEGPSTIHQIVRESSIHACKSAPL